MKLSERGLGLARDLSRSGLSDDELTSLRHIWESAEKRLGVSLTQLGTYDEEFPASQELVHERVFPFLDLTGLVLTGADLQYRFELRVDGKLYLFSIREWGGYQAEWMESRYLDLGGSLSYLDFYDRGFISKIVEDYEIFLTNLERIR